MNPSWNDVMKFDLGDKPIIFDIGGYKGDFTEMCLEKYPNAEMIYLFEPHEEYYRSIFKRFLLRDKTIKNVRIFRLGISDLHGQKYMYGAGDSKSTIESEGIKTVSTFITLENVHQCYPKDVVDLIKLNVEGAEYEILEKIISDNTATIYKNILVQFHKNVPKYEKRRDAIQEKLSETHELIFNYPFIFEGWQIKK